MKISSKNYKKIWYRRTSEKTSPRATNVLLCRKKNLKIPQQYTPQEEEWRMAGITCRRKINPASSPEWIIHFAVWGLTAEIYTTASIIKLTFCFTRDSSFPPPQNGPLFRRGSKKIINAESIKTLRNIYKFEYKCPNDKWSEITAQFPGETVKFRARQTS